jgi:hypothetical protein
MAAVAHHTSDHPTGWRRYLYSTNHQDIGTMYLVFALTAGIIGGALSIGMRMELQQPGLQIFANSHAYDVFTTAHGLIMIFFMVKTALLWETSASSTARPVMRSRLWHTARPRCSIRRCLNASSTAP